MAVDLAVIADPNIPKRSNKALLELVEEVRKGSSGAEKKFVDRIAIMFWPSIMRSVKDPHAAAEILNDVQLMALNYLPHFDAEGNIQGWLHTAMFYRVYNHKRQEAKRLERLEVLRDELTQFESNRFPQLEEFLQKLKPVLRYLSYRERQIIKLHFGLGDQEYTLDEIGTLFQLSRERIRQIEAKAIRKLQNYFRAIAPAE